MSNRTLVNINFYLTVLISNKFICENVAIILELHQTLFKTLPKIKTPVSLLYVFTFSHIKYIISLKKEAN